MDYFLIIIGVSGLWACLWLWRAGWPRRKKYGVIDSDTVCRVSEKNHKKDLIITLGPN